MKIPDKIKIGAHEYSIIWSEDIIANEDRWGTHCHRKLELVIASNMAKSRQLETLIHEVLHGIDCDNELGLQHSHLSSIASGFTAFLIDNNLLRG